MDIDVSPAFEERLSAHKVVTTPRGRLVGSDGPAGSPQRRPRSLSAPRTRQRAADLVQNLYDRMGVNYQRGQVTDLNSSATPANERGNTMPQPFLSRPTTPSNFVGTPSNSSSIFQRQQVEESNSTGFGEITQSRSFHERYRVATSRGRALDRPLAATTGSGTTTTTEENTEARPRSLSRGRVAQRWPPARTEEAPLANSVPIAQTQSKTTHSPSRSHVRPPWMESTGGSFNSGSCNISQARSVEAEEKKEEQAQDINLSTPVSLKDRISVFGTKKGSSTKSNRTSRSTRNVDPKYAAQFAMRDHPPKIDIYADSKEPQTESTDLSTVTSPTATNELGKTQQQQSPPPAGGTQASSTGKKLGSLAVAYMSAIQSPTKSPKSPTKPSVPPREIAVSAATDLGLTPNDSQSLAGFSTVSGDELSNVQAKVTTTAPINVSKRQNWRISQAPKTQSQAASNNVSSMPSPTLVPSDEVLERLVEDRVQERVVDLESKIEARLRNLVSAMEERVMARLDSIERKMMQEI